MLLISKRAAALLFGEVQRWVEAGLSRAGVPLECLLYPLTAMVPSDGLLSPLELVHLDQIRALVIDGVAIPPDNVKSFSAHNCHFSAEDIEAANQSFNAAIDAQLELHPRLAVLSKLHSHPFPGGAFLSSGDVHYGVRTPAAVAWRERRGLGTAILHVVHPDRDPRASQRPWRLGSGGAVAAEGAERVKWRVRSWATDRAGSLVDLGDAQIVANDHPLVQATRRRPYWRTTAGAQWCDRQKAALREDGYQVSRNLLGRGWRRYLMGVGGAQLVFALPPDLPIAPPRVLRIEDALTNRFIALDLPAWASSGLSFSRFSLLRLARHFGPPT